MFIGPMALMSIEWPHMLMLTGPPHAFGHIMCLNLLKSPRFNPFYQMFFDQQAFYKISWNNFDFLCAFCVYLLVSNVMGKRRDVSPLLGKQFNHLHNNIGTEWTKKIVFMVKHHIQLSH